MASLVWSRDLNTGIEVIDKQHQRIVKYINELDDARSSGRKMEELGRIIDEMVEYTLSHFSFEESMIEEAQYPFIKAHKRVHETFTIKVSGLQHRFAQGEDVSEELHKMLFSWLYNHIKRDDADYVEFVAQNVQQANFIAKKKGFFSRLFG
ncbi:MAG: bacteriohemerythrin [Gallionella sp.]|nr:bacteriohemerythrin [Gallionella sp.]